MNHSSLTLYTGTCSNFRFNSGYLVCKNAEAIDGLILFQKWPTFFLHVGRLFQPNQRVKMFGTGVYQEAFILKFNSYFIYIMRLRQSLINFLVLQTISNFYFGIYNDSETNCAQMLGTLSVFYFTRPLALTSFIVSPGVQFCDTVIFIFLLYLIASCKILQDFWHFKIYFS